MLEWIWFGALSSAAAVLGAMEIYEESRPSDSDNRIPPMMWAMICMVVALVMSWDVLGAPLMAFYSSVLPEANTPVHVLTVFVLLGLTAIAYVFAVGLGVPWLCFEGGPLLWRKARRGSATAPVKGDWLDRSEPTYGTLYIFGLPIICDLHAANAVERADWSLRVHPLWRRFCSVRWSRTSMAQRALEAVTAEMTKAGKH